MKILLISFSHHPTLQNYIYLLKENLSKFECSVYSIGNKNIKTLYDVGDNSSFVECLDTALPSISNLKLFFKQKNKICKIIDDISPDAILFTSKHIWNALLLKFIKKRKIKVFHVFHDPVGHNGTSVGKSVIMYNKILSIFLNGIIVHSKVSYRDTMQYIHPKCPVTLAPLGEKKWLPYKKPQKYKNRLLVFGRISTYKGCEYISKVANILGKKFPSCQIIVAGKCLDDVPDGFELELSKCKNVTFHNKFIDEVELDDYFYSCDASLILHKSISQSGVIIDAYRHGHPIFCFDIDGMSEFANKNTAYISRPFDCESIVSNIIDLYSDFAKYSEKSLMAYQFGKKTFSEKSFAEKVFEAIVKGTVI